MGETGRAPGADGDRQEQLNYSSLQPVMADERHRRRKAAKILAVLRHFLGSGDLGGLTAIDVGCSLGYMCDELRRAGATVTGVDIDTAALESAQARFGDEITFLPSSGERMPFPDRSFDIVVFNHIYEHTVDPDAVLREIQRIVKVDGVVYLGLGNRYGVVEPHYRLPFLSWLPPGLADRYIRLSGRSSRYYERLQSRRSLRRFCAAWNVWEYTFAVLGTPKAYSSADMVKGPLTRVPPAGWRLLTPIIPTFIWVATLGGREPAGPRTASTGPKKIISRQAPPPDRA